MHRSGRLGIVLVALSLGGGTGTGRADSGLPPGIYVTDEGGSVHSVDPSTGATTEVADLPGTQVYDIAFDDAGDLWVLEGPSRRLSTWDPVGGGLVLRTLTCASQNGLDVRGTDGMPLASGGTSFFEQDPSSPTCAVTISVGESSAGDVARSPITGRTFVTTGGIAGGVLREIDFASGTSIPRGNLGNPCGAILPPSWQGLAFLDDGRLIGTTRSQCNQLCFIDPDSAAASGCVNLGWGFSGLAVRRGILPPCPQPVADSARAMDLDACNHGIELTWGAARWPPGRSGVYNVRRLDASCGGAAQLLATGLSATSFTDMTAPEGLEVTYVVEAEDDSRCGGGVHQSGMTASSPCTTPVQDVFDAVAPPNRAGDSLRVAKGPAEEALLSWTVAGVPTDERIAVTRCELPDASFLELPGSSVSPHVDPQPLGATRRWHYLVVTIDGCDNRSP